MFRVMIREVNKKSERELVNLDELGRAYDFLRSEVANGAESDVSFYLRFDDYLIANGVRGRVYLPALDDIIAHHSNELHQALYDIHTEYEQPLVMMHLPIQVWLMANKNPFALLSLFGAMGLEPKIDLMLAKLQGKFWSWVDAERLNTEHESEYLECVNALYSDHLNPNGDDVYHNALSWCKKSDVDSDTWRLARLVVDMTKLAKYAATEFEHKAISSAGIWQQIMYITVRFVGSEVVEASEVLGILSDTYPLNNVNELELRSVQSWYRQH